MASANSNSDKRISGKIYGCLSLIVGVVLLVSGLAFYRMGTATIKEVNDGLVAEKLYFPPAGNPAFSAEAFPDAQKYAGKQVVNGDLAKAYAEDFIGVQLELLGNGKVLSEVSNDLAMDPGNAGLQQLQANMFQLETAKTSLLANGYGAGLQGQMIKKAGVAATAAGLVLLVVSAIEFMRAKRA